MVGHFQFHANTVLKNKDFQIFPDNIFNLSKVSGGLSGDSNFIWKRYLFLYVWSKKKMHESARRSNIMKNVAMSMPEFFFLSRHVAE